MKHILIIIMALMCTSCTRYDGTTTMLLKDLDVSFTMVDSLPNGQHGRYDYDTDTIVVVRGKQTPYLLLHELVHKLRASQRLSKRTEEIVACRAAYKIGKLAGIALKVSKRTLPIWTNLALKVNGMRPERITPEYEELLDKEVEITIQLVNDELKKKGLSLTDIDYVKTAILLLL